MEPTTSTILAHAPATTLEHAEYAFEDGRRREYAIVRRPMAAAVAALRVTTNIQVLLIGQPRPPVDDPALVEIVAGKMEYGERDPYLTAQRELSEEAGLIARSWRMLVQDWYPAPGYSTEHVHIMAAWDLTEFPRRDEDSHITTTWVDLGDAMGMVRRGLIRDGKTREALWTVWDLVGCGELTANQLNGQRP